MSRVDSEDAGGAETWQKFRGGASRGGRRPPRVLSSRDIVFPSPFHIPFLCFLAATMRTSLPYPSCWDEIRSFLPLICSFKYFGHECTQVTNTSMAVFGQEHILCAPLPTLCSCKVPRGSIMWRRRERCKSSVLVG